MNRLEEGASPAPAPWKLAGSAVVMLSGWQIVGFINYTDSPVGPYREYAEASFTCLGPTVTTMLVTSRESMAAGRANWGYPKQIGDLEWSSQQGRIIFRNAKQKWRLRSWGFSMPFHLKFWTVQTLHNQSVRVPFEVAGYCRLAFQGRRWALYFETITLNVQAAHEL